MPPPGSADRPLRVAVVGAGPAGLYATEALLRRPDPVIEVDVFDRFPAPFGLVRDGVGPRPPVDQGGGRVLERILAGPRVRLFGNVTFGVDLHHRDLKRHYDQVVYAVGAQADRRMSIPGEDLPTATRPSRSSAGTTASPTTASCPSTSPASGRWWSATATWPWTWPASWPPPPTSWPRPTSPTTPWRRCGPAGPARSWSWAAGGGPGVLHTPELKELGKLDGVDVVVDPANIELDPASRTVVEEDRTARANLKILREYAARDRRDAHRDPSRIEAVPRRRGIDYTTYQGWRVLDGHEPALGASQGRPRVKVCSLPEMLEVIHRGA